MLQPTGPQDAALLLAALQGASPLAAWVPKSERAFLAWLLPQWGHFSSGAAEFERTSFSYFWPQF